MSKVTPTGITESCAAELDAFTAIDNALESADHAIDLMYGQGFAEKHPQLVAGYLQAAAIAYLANLLGDRVERVMLHLDAKAGHHG